MHFCRICKSIVRIQTTYAGVSFVCEKCKTTTPGTIEDTLISGDPTGGRAGEESQQRIFLDQFARDPTSFYIMRDCVCGMDIMARAVLGADMQVFYGCPNPACGKVERAKK